jgi:hypothetical protein
MKNNLIFFLLGMVAALLLSQRKPVVLAAPASPAPPRKSRNAYELSPTLKRWEDEGKIPENETWDDLYDLAQTVITEAVQPDMTEMEAEAARSAARASNMQLAMWVMNKSHPDVDPQKPSWEEKE